MKGKLAMPAFVLLLLLLLGSTYFFGSEARMPPLDSNATRPPVDQGGFVNHTEEVTVQVPMPFLHAWRRASSGRLENTLRGTNKIAGVASTEMIQGTWPEVGALRRVVRKDGNQSLEEVLVNTWPTWFRYEVWGFTDKERILTNYLVGEFQHREVPGGTAVKWTYSFHRRSLFAAPFLSMAVRSRVPEFMRTALQNMKQQAEQAYKEQPDEVGSNADSKPE
jgi:hypothetical protein